MEDKRIRMIPPYCENLIRQFEEVKMGGYSLEKLRQILEDDSWKEKYANFHVPEKLMLFYRMDGYMEALKILFWMKMKRMPVTIASEEEKLSQELTEEIGQTVRHTISRFLAQRDHPDSVSYDEISEKSTSSNEQISDVMRASAACYYGNLGYNIYTPDLIRFLGFLSNIEGDDGLISPKIEDIKNVIHADIAGENHLMQPEDKSNSAN